MNKLLPLSFAVLPCFAACAGAKYRIDAGAFFASASGDVALQNAGGTLELGQNQIDLEDDLGLGDTEPSPYLRGQMDKDRHRVRVHGFGIDSEGQGTLSGDYGGLVAGSVVDTELTFFSAAANYGYQILRGRNHRVAIGGQLGYYSLDVEARSSSGFEEVNTSVVVPMPFAEAEALFGSLTLGVNGAVMAADLGDGSGRYLDLEGYVRWSATPDFDFFGGYRYVVLDAYGTASSRDFDADVEVQGFFFGAGVRF